MPATGQASSTCDGAMSDNRPQIQVTLPLIRPSRTQRNGSRHILFVTLFSPPVLKGFTVTGTETGMVTPLASVTLTVKLLIPLLVGVAENTRLKSPSKPRGSRLAMSGEVKVTGFAPLATQVSTAFAALKLTRECASFTQTQPAGMEIATLLTAAQPLLVGLQINSTLVLEALVANGLTTVGNSPRVMTGDVAAGAVSAGDTLVADPVKVNGLVAAALFI